VKALGASPIGISFRWKMKGADPCGPAPALARCSTLVALLPALFTLLAALLALLLGAVLRAVLTLLALLGLLALLLLALRGLALLALVLTLLALLLAVLVLLTRLALLTLLVLLVLLVLLALRAGTALLASGRLTLVGLLSHGGVSVNGHWHMPTTSSLQSPCHRGCGAAGDCGRPADEPVDSRKYKR
jgi:hypothetical protein